MGLFPRRNLIVSLIVAIILAAFPAAGQDESHGTKITTKSSAADSKYLAPGGIGYTYKENFTVLPAAQNSLKIETALLGERDDKPGTPFIRERWQLEWRPGDPLDVYIVKPRGVTNPPVILYLYSYPQDTDRFKQDYWCGVTTGDGFAAVGFVSALTGQRFEYRSLKDDFFNRLPEAMGASAHDVQMILDFLATRDEFDMSRVGMFGQGSGGSIAILASAADPRIKALDVLTPWGDWPDFLRESKFVPNEDKSLVITPSFLTSVAGLDPLEWFSKVKAQNVRIQDVRKDGHTPDAAQAKMEAAAPTIAEIDQFGDAAALVPAAMNGKLLDWIKSQLKSSPTTQVARAQSQRIHVYPAREPANPLQ